MKSYGYYIYQGNPNDGLNWSSRASDKYPLMVNCAGKYEGDIEKINTYNRSGRLDYYLLYIVGGELEIMLPNGFKKCAAGEFVIFPPKHPYRYRITNGTALSYVWIHFTGGKVLETLSELQISIYPDINKIVPENTVITRFQSICNAFARQDAFREREISLLFERLLISLARRIAPAEYASKAIAKSIDYINSNYNMQIKIPQLAALENLSVSRYNAVFRNVMNMSPSEYIAKTRISAACELLLSTDMLIKEAALLVGYTDSHFFCKMFNKIMKVSPSEFKKMTEKHIEF